MERLLKNYCGLGITIFLLFLVSCGNDMKDTKQEPTKSIDIPADYKVSFSILKDTEKVSEVFKDSLYNILIEYESPMDSINTVIFDDDHYPMRAIYFCRFPDSKLNLTELIHESQNSKAFDRLKEQNDIDTVYAVSNKLIPMMDVRFKEVGETYINGFIYDFAYIKQKDSTKIRFISQEIMATHKIVVKE